MKKIITLSIIIISFSSHIFAQCNMDRHNTTWYDGWTSCSTANSPNNSRGESHWIMYNLGYKYQLKSSYWWNYNETERLIDGAKTVMVDYSLDGSIWNEWGTIELPQASGLNSYEGIQGPDFNGIEAQYLLFTIISNHGGTCFGLGEMKVDVDFVSSTNIVNNDDKLNINAFPNPFTNQITITTPIGLGDNYFISIEDVLGQTIATLPFSELKNKQIVYDGSNLRSGVYFVVISKEGQIIRKKILKVK